MKKYLLLLLAAVLLFAGCNPNDKTDNNCDNQQNEQPGKTEPIVIPASQNISPTFDANGGTATVSFTTTSDWIATVTNTRADAWCTVFPTNGSKGSNSITIKVAASDIPDDRAAVVQIVSGTAAKNINVTQKQKDAITVTTNRFEVGKEGGLVEIEAKANVKISYSIEDKAKDWISYVGTRAMSTSILSFKVEANTTSEKREATIILSNGALSEKVTVYQEAGSESPSIVISRNEYTVGAAGETVKVEISSNVDVEMVLPGVDWIKENQTKAMSTHTYYLVVSPNEGYESRSADIIFRNRDNNLEEKVTVNQLQKDAIVLAKRLYDIDNSGGDIQIEVAHNVEYNMSISVDWITKVGTKAMETDRLNFNVAPNSSNDRRE